MVAFQPLRLLRFCFTVLFGTMSLMHGPVMVYGPSHAPAAHHDGHNHDDAPANPASRSDAAMCNSFLCFLAVDPITPFARPLHAIMIGTMTLSPQSEPTTAVRTPDLPPPRTHS